MDEHGPVLPTRLRRPAISTIGEVGRVEPHCLDPLTRAALDSAPVGMIVLDNDMQVQLVTRKAAHCLGLRYGIHAGRTLMQIAGQSHALDLPALRTLGALLGDLTGEHSREALLTLPGPDGGKVARLTIHRAEEQGWLITVDEPRPVESAHAFLLQQDAADPVTGLANKRHFLRTLRDRLETCDGRLVAVLRLSLQMPDQTTDPDHALLRTASRRIQFCIRSNDLAARFIGTEFAVLFTQLSDRAILRQLSDRLSDAIARPFTIEGKSIQLRGHIGLAGTPEDGTTPEELLANAEIALSAARTGRAGAWHAFETHLDDVAAQRRHVELGLRRALTNQEFVLHYQPQIEVVTGRVRVLEALIRWQSPDRGMVPPNDFIPVAESTGQIRDIGNWVVAQACREAAGWPDDIAVAVNASPLQIEDAGFADAVAHALHRAGLPARRLEIEITENLLLQANDSVNATLMRLRDMGVHLVMDDFGTGYASLSQLARFRFNKIKIDRSLVSAADTVAEHSAIVRAIAALGVSLCVPTTAEGVETVSQLDRIAQDGCTLVQGFYFSRPVPADAVPALLEKLSAAAQFQAA